MRGGRYKVPVDPSGGYSIEMRRESIEEFEYPGGSYWKKRLQEEQEQKK